MVFAHPGKAPCAAMSLHTPTILFVIIAASAVLAAALAFIAYRRHPELGLWSLAMALHALAYTLFSLRGQIGDFVSVVVGNVALAASLAVLGEGIYRFQQRPSPRALLWLPVALVALNCSLLLDHFTPRAAVNAFLVALLAGLALRGLWQYRRQTAGRGQYLLAAGLLAVLGVAASRAAVFAGGADEVATILSSQTGHAASFIAVLVTLLLVALGLLSMTQERAEAAVKSSEDYEHFRSGLLDLLSSGEALPALLQAFVDGVERLRPGSGCSVVVQGSVGAAFAAAHAAPARGVGGSWPLLSADRQLLGSLALHQPAAVQGQAGEQALAEGLAKLAALAIERSENAQRLRASEKLYRQLIEAANEGICIVQEGVLRYVNPRMRELVGYDDAELVGRQFLDFVHAADREFVARDRRAGPNSADRNLRRPLRLLAKGRGERWFEVSGVAFDWQGQAATLNFLSDITERKLMDDQVHELAYHDALTGLPNRRMLLDHLQLVLAANRRNGRHGAVVFLDLDNFKPLNDRHGHTVGDLLLVEVARRLLDNVRDMDTVARFGGDEFVVLLSELSEAEAEARTQAQQIAEKVRRAVAETYLLRVEHEGRVSTVEHHCSASVGVQLFVGTDFRAGAEDTLLDLADAAMYQAKEAGSNTVYFQPRVGA